MDSLFGYMEYRMAEMKKVITPFQNGFPIRDAIVMGTHPIHVITPFQNGFPIRVWVFKLHTN